VANATPARIAATVAVHSDVLRGWAFEEALPWDLLERELPRRAGPADVLSWCQSLEGLSVAEIAAARGVKVGTVRQSLRQCRKIPRDIRAEQRRRSRAD
jgi:DNA-directed RNA polymerase specialized sigma24 family protein